MPPSLREWLPDDHLVHFIADLVEETLDPGETLEHYGGPARGTVPHDPRMLTAVILYGYRTSVIPPDRRKHGEDIPPAAPWLAKRGDLRCWIL